VRPRRPWFGFFQAAHQIAPHLLDQRRLPVEKITDRLQLRLKPQALPQQFQIGKAHLSRRRPRHGSTPQAEKCRPQPSRSAPHPADNIDRPFGEAANHLSNESHRTPLWQAKLALKNAENLDSTARSCFSRQKLAHVSLLRAGCDG